MTIPIPVLTAACLALAACTVGPDYKTPESQPPQTWAEPAGGGAAYTHAHLTRWWTTLNDQPLTSLVERAVAANLDLRIARARVREARAQRGIISADLWPNVDV